MKVTYKIDKIKKNRWLNIAFDVSKDDLHMYTETGEETISCISDSFANKTDAIINKLKQMQQTALSSGYEGLHIVCEPSGGYEAKLMQLASGQGHGASYVSGEASNKFKLVEDNSAEKSDQRDARVIFKLARYGKFLKYRPLENAYAQLRHFNRMHEQEQELKSTARSQLHHELKVLFCEHDWKESFWYGVSGRAILSIYQGNPYKILRAGKSRFVQRMRSSGKGIRCTTIDRIWHCACSSVKLALPKEQSDLIAYRIKQIWEDYRLHDHRPCFERFDACTIKTGE